MGGRPVGYRELGGGSGGEDLGRVTGALAALASSLGTVVRQFGAAAREEFKKEDAEDLIRFPANTRAAIISRYREVMEVADLNDRPRFGAGRVGVRQRVGHVGSVSHG